MSCFLKRKQRGIVIIKVNNKSAPAAITVVLRVPRDSTKSVFTCAPHYSLGIPLSGLYDKKNRDLGLQIPEHLYCYSKYSAISYALSVLSFKFSKSDWASAMNSSGKVSPFSFAIFQEAYQEKKQS